MRCCNARPAVRDAKGWDGDEHRTSAPNASRKPSICASIYGGRDDANAHPGAATATSRVLPRMLPPAIRAGPTRCAKRQHGRQGFMTMAR